MTSSKRQSAPAHPNWVLATTILASGLAFIDGTVVNVGLSAIGTSFKGGAADLQWVINAYLLPLSTLLLLGGAAGDRFGRTRLLVIGTTIFAAASIVCAFAPTLPWLLTGRAIQGTSAALLMPNSLAILGAAFAGEKKGRAIGIWAAAGAALAAVGPVLGGWLIDNVGWRSMFYLNLPPADRRDCPRVAFRAEHSSRQENVAAGYSRRIARDGVDGRDHLGTDHRLGPCRLDDVGHRVVGRRRCC